MAQNRQFGGIGSLLAMLAVLLHLVLSFAHIHAPLPPAANAAVATGSVDGTAPSPPLDIGTDDGCAICANIAAFASLDLPAPVILSLPLRAIGFAPPWQGDNLTLATRYRLFYGRAPPLLGNP